MKKILSLMALLMVMATTAWADDVKVTWAMGDNTAGVADPTTAASDIKYTVGTGLTQNTATATCDDVVFTKFDQNTGNDKGNNGDGWHDGNVDLGKYVDFTFTPVGGDFTPTKVSFDVIKIGTGDPNIYVDVIDGTEKTIAVASNVTIRKSSDSSPSISQSFEVSGATSSDGAVTLRIIFGKLASGKAVGLANVVIEGTLVSASAPVLGATKEVTLKSFPLKPTATATIALTGKNLTDGTYNAPTPASEGLTIEPASFTVSGGALSQEFTLTYAPTADANTSEELTFTIGDMSATTTVALEARIAPYKQTIVSEAASWDWETLTETVELTDESVPSKNDDFVFRELEDQINFGTFDAQSIVISKTQYPSRNKKFQNGTIKFKTNRPGKITVDFSDTGSSGDNPVKRYLRVNDEDTEYYTQRDGSSDRKVSGEIAVPAGEVSITGWDPTAEVKDNDGNVIGTGNNVPICVYKVTFEPTGDVVPEEPVTATFNFADPNFRENIGEGLTDAKGNIYNEAFTADGVTMQVTAGSAATKLYVDNKVGQNLVTYKDYATMTFRAPEGKAITKIEFELAKGNFNFEASSGAIEETTWTGNADGVRFFATGTTNIAKAIVTLSEAEAKDKLADIEYVEVESIARFNALQAGTYAKLTLTDAEVIAKSADGFSTAWIQDATGGAWIQYCSLIDQIAESTKLNGTVYAVKRDASGNPQIKDAEDTPKSELTAEAIDQLTVIEGETIAAVNTAENLNRVVKFSGATLEETSTTAGTLTLGEETIAVNNGAETANQQLHKIAEWAKDTKLENIEMVAILVAKSATENQLLPISIELKGETEAGEELNVERYTGLGYNTTEATVDFAAAKEFLGVEEVTTDMLAIINPDGTEITAYAGYDGWFNGEGAAEYWGDNARINVKFFQAIPNGTYSICDMNGADEIGKTYTVKWALKANGKTYTYSINVTFVETPEVGELTQADLRVNTSVEYTTDEGSYVTKWASLTDEDVQAILAELGLGSLDEATVYGYNPTTGELINNYVGFDGWRDANGDFHNWTGNAEAPFCIKYNDGQNYECYNIGGLEPQTFKGYWAIANDEKYVLVEIDFIYAEPAPIELTLTNVEVEANVTYNITWADYTEQTITLTDEEVKSILDAIELTSFEDEACEAYVYDPATQSFSRDSEGSWRDANGLAHAWTGTEEAPACVQFRYENTLYCYNLYGIEPQTITTYWAIANTTTGKAALIKVNFVYEGTYPTYTVAGVFGEKDVDDEDEIFGKAWDLNLEANNMTKADRTTWTLTIENVELTAGTIWYKVFADHSNDTSWGFNYSDDNIYGNADYVVNMPEGYDKAVFDITFTFSPVAALSNGFNVTCDVVFDELITGISSIATEKQNGEAIYNLQGVRLEKLQKGLNIVGGKKVVIK